MNRSRCQASCLSGKLSIRRRLPNRNHRPSQISERLPALPNKQIQFVLNLAKRHGLATPKLEDRIAEILGRRIGLYELSKRDAGVVLDSFTADSKPATASR